jgi:hypothetical protein
MRSFCFHTALLNQSFIPINSCFNALSENKNPILKLERLFIGKPLAILCSRFDGGFNPVVSAAPAKVALHCGSDFRIIGIGIFLQ